MQKSCPSSCVLRAPSRSRVVIGSVFGIVQGYMATTSALAAEGTSSPPPAPPSTASPEGSAATPPTAPAPGAGATRALPASESAAPEAPPGTAPRPGAESPKIVLSTPEPSRAQCEPCEKNKDAAEGAGELLVGPGVFDFSSLNDHLAANGYERLGSVMTIVGGEGHAIFPSGFVAGARGGALLGPSGNGPSVRTHLSGGFGMLDFGFAMVHTTHALFTLTGGIGGYGLSLGIGDDQSASFDSLLKNPRHSVSMGQGGLLVGLTLGIDFRVPTGDVEHGRRGFFTLGARVAGLYGPPIGGWDVSEGDSATDGPRTGLAGGYAALAIGFGGGSVPTSSAGNAPSERP